MDTGYYRIIRYGVSRALTTPDLASFPNGRENGTDAFLYDIYDAGGTGYNQLWKVEPAGNGYFRLVNKGSGRILTTPDLAATPHGNENGARAFIYDQYFAAGTGYNQLWKLEDQGNGYNRIVHYGSQRNLTTPDVASHPNGNGNGARVMLWDRYVADGTGYNQQWQFQPASIAQSSLTIVITGGGTPAEVGAPIPGVLNIFMDVREPVRVTDGTQTTWVAGGSVVHVAAPDVAAVEYESVRHTWQDQTVGPGVVALDSGNSGDTIPANPSRPVVVYFGPNFRLGQGLIAAQGTSNLPGGPNGG